MKTGFQSACAAPLSSAALLHAAGANVLPIGHQAEHPSRARVYLHKRALSAECRTKRLKRAPWFPPAGRRTPKIESPLGSNDTPQEIHFKVLAPVIFPANRLLNLKQ
jgi:hypothetical protein